METSVRKSRRSIFPWKWEEEPYSNRTRELGAEEETKRCRNRTRYTKKGGKHLFQERWEIFNFVDNYKSQYSIEKMCSVMQVSRSGYYAWIKRPTSKRSQENNRLTEKIKHIYQNSKQTYGSPRITEELNRQNLKVSRPRVARLMKKAMIRSKVRKKYVVTTDSKHDYPVAPNLLERNFTANNPGTKWVSDITYIKVKSKWLYLTTIIDLFDRKVIGWALSHTMSANQTTIPALKMAINNRDKQDSIIFHSDRGIQYASQDFRDLLFQNKMKQSMSRKGNCWDNAVAESFFKTIKTECTNHIVFDSLDHAKLEIFKYIETWYNRKRRHSALGYATPLEMEILFANKMVA